MRDISDCETSHSLHAGNPNFAGNYCEISYRARDTEGNERFPT